MSNQPYPPKDTSFTGNIRRLVAALRSRGIRRTAQSFVDLAEDAFFDYRYGIRSSEVDLSPPAGFDVKGANREHGKCALPVRVRHLRRLLNRIPVESRKTFVDFGSGTGRTLFVAHQCGFREAVGVEFAAELWEFAEENVRRFEASTGKKSGIWTIHLDATEFEVEPEDTVFYFYDPFDGEVLAPVLSTIERSLRVAPRTAWLLYTNPVHMDLIERMPGFAEERRETWGAEETIVYRFDPSRARSHPRWNASRHADLMAADGRKRTSGRLPFAANRRRRP